jgi:glutathione synthase/RimK-type ligase-like ATP-grasp enzyme
MSDNFMTKKILAFLQEQSESTPVAKKEISMDERIVQKLQIPTNRSIHITLGRNKEKILVVPINNKNQHINCHKEILEALRYPICFENPVAVSFQPENDELSLGPVIALLTEIKEGKENSFGSLQDFAIEMAMWCAKNGILFYVSSIDNFNPENIEGFICHQHSWKKTNVPIPSVVYNRIHSRKLEASQEFLALKQFLLEQNIPIFNDQFLNKWEVHEVLNLHEYLNPYLPESHLLTSKEILKECIEKWGCVFLKPIHGSQGKKIIRITKHDDQYFVDYSTDRQDVETNFSSFQELFHSLKNRLRQRRYLVQQCLPIISYKNRIVDFRFLCHKTNSLEWKVTSAVARLSPVHSIVSNIAQGGQLIPVTDVLTEYFDEKSIFHIKKLLKELTIEVARVISSSFQGLYGELGIDLAIDSNGKPWIIEVNTKPSKNFDPLKENMKIRPSAKAILEYSLLLASRREDP